MKKTVLFLLAPVFFIMLSACDTSFVQKSLVNSHSSINLVPKDFEIIDKITIYLTDGNVVEDFKIKETFGSIPMYMNIDESYVEAKLLEKAYNLGADEIVNVRVGVQNHKFSNGSATTVWFGSALAIKYKDSSTAEAKIAETQPQNENAPKARARRSQRTQQN